MSIETSQEVQRILNNVYDDSINKLRVDAAITLGSISIPADGAIVDGYNSAIKATVFDYTNANPLGVILLDTSGDPAALNATISGTLNASILNPSTYITNTSIPVTGTFYQATQPVSLASTINASIVNPSTFVTNFPATQAVTFSGTVNSSILNPSTYVTNFPSTQTITGTVDVNQPVSVWTDGNDLSVIVGNTVPVTGAFYQATQPVSLASTVNTSVLNPSTYITNANMPTTPVTGTFWQGTQPISGTVTANLGSGSTVAISGTVPVSGTFWQATQPVSGTFYQATQPVSLASTINTSVLNPSTYVTNASMPVTGTFWQSTQPVSLAATINTSILNPSTFFYPATQPVSLAATVNTSILNTNIASSIMGGGVTQVGNWAITSVNTLTSMNGQPISMNTGVRDAGTQRVTIATNDIVPASQSGTWNIGSVNTVTSMNGQPISMNTGVRDAGTQRVTIATNDIVPASQSGTWNIGTLTTATTVSSLTGGNTLVDGAVNLNPLNIGARAAQANPTAVSASGDLVNVMTDDVGRLVMVKNHIRDLVTQNRLVLASSTETSILAAGGSGVFQDLTMITVANTSTSTPVNVDIRDATGGTIRQTFTCPGGATTGVVFDSPFTQTTANNPWTIQCSAAVTSIITTIQAVKNV